jgi:hypothetical protein
LKWSAGIGMLIGLALFAGAKYLPVGGPEAP